MRKSRKFFIIILIFLSFILLTNIDNVKLSGYDNVKSDGFPYNFDTYQFDSSPKALNITYYNGIYSRGFTYITDTSNNETELFIKELNSMPVEDWSIDDKVPSFQTSCTTITYSGGRNTTSNYSSKIESLTALYNKNGYGTDISSISVNIHSAYVLDLKPDTSYKYIIGGNDSYIGGMFTTSKSKDDSIEILNFNDFEIYNKSKLYTVANTIGAGFYKSNDVDFIINGGDKFNAYLTDTSINRLTRYGVTTDSLYSFIESTPVMSVTGDHDTSLPYFNDLSNEIYLDNSTYNNIAYNGLYYSFNYQYAHFVFLNTNLSDSETLVELDWLKEDLQNANNNKSIKWIIVSMHEGPYSTGGATSTSKREKLVEKFCPIFSKYHVDLVLQAHDHVFTKTLSYNWDNDYGYTTTHNNNDVVLYNPTQIEYNDEYYDYRPNGTYYVECGAVSDKTGVTGKNSDGNWASVTYNNQFEIVGTSLKDSNDTLTRYLDNKYKIEVGKIKGSSSINTTTYNVNDPSSGNVDGQMFGRLIITKDILKYEFYTINESDINLLDSLNVCKDIPSKSLEDLLQNDEVNDSNIFTIIKELFDEIKDLTVSSYNKLLNLFNLVKSNYESSCENDILDDINTFIKLCSIQSSSIENDSYSIRLIGGIDNSYNEIPVLGFMIDKFDYNDLKYDYSGIYPCLNLYSEKIESTTNFLNELKVSDYDNRYLYSLTINDIPINEYIKLLITPYGKNKNGEYIYGTSIEIELYNGYFNPDIYLEANDE